MILASSIEKVKNEANIVDVITSTGIALKKKGSNYTCTCPFHNEKSASFSVDPSKQIYKCFGCGASGDSIKFLQEHKGFQFHEAIEWLAEKYNIALEYDGATVTKEEKDEKKKALDFMGTVKRMYHDALRNNEAAMAYLTARGFTTETIALWELGYAPDVWRTITDYAIKNNCWDLAVKCGVCVESGDKNRDFFKNRIIIPISDEKGNTISFGGRIWTQDQDDKKEPKYLNGPETFIYDKGKVLFGLYRAMSHINKQGAAYLVEGYFDVIMSHQYELNHVIAACGTGVTDWHVKSIVKRAKKIVLAGDNDAAGEKSILKSIDMFLEAGALQVDVIEWPEGIKDIDQYLKQAI